MDDKVAVTKRRIPGTPLGGERTPTVPMTPPQAHREKVARLTTLMHTISTPAASSSSVQSSDEPLTMSALRDLFDDKLQPVTTGLSKLRFDFDEYVDMTETYCGLFCRG